MKFIKIALLSAIVFALAFIALAIAFTYVSPSRSVDYLKERIPDATQFFVSFEESFAVIQGIQDRANDFDISISRDNILRLTEYYDDVMGRVASQSALSISESNFLSEEEKSAILVILSSQEAQGFGLFAIVVCQDYTLIAFDRHPFYAKSHAEMHLRNTYRPYIPSSTWGPTNYYYEQISDMWYIEILFMH